MLLLVTPVTISAPIAPTQALIVAGLVITVVANAVLLRRAVSPLERLANRMDTVDLLPPELAVYRIAQESLTNVARHSKASSVTIAIERGHDSVVLRVADDGRGFDTSRPNEHAACATCASAPC